MPTLKELSKSLPCLHCWTHFLPFPPFFQYLFPHFRYLSPASLTADPFREKVTPLSLSFHVLRCGLRPSRDAQEILEEEEEDGTAVFQFLIKHKYGLVETPGLKVSSPADVVT